MKMIKKNLIPILIFALLVAFFFTPLFYPEPKILATPDLGGISDVWHLNFPLKNFLRQSLTNYKPPLWNKYIGAGQPILAEGEIGAFFIPNLILFYLLPTHIAFNLSLALMILTAGLGTYLYCKAIKLDNSVSLFAATVFGFNGFLMVHFNQFNLVQAASILPLLFFLSHLLITKKRIIYLLLLTITLSQQIFIGSAQITFISLTGLSLYFLFFTLPKKIIKFKKASAYDLKIPVLFFLVLILAALLSTIQLLPSWELKGLSSRRSGLPFEQATKFSSPPNNLLSFISPYFFGNPVSGTHPPPSNNWGIYWEYVAYLGIIPLVLFLLGIALTKKRLKNFYFLLFLLSILLVPGKFSPLYLVFYLPPFNLFRFHSRFLLLAVWSITIISSLTLQNLKQLSIKRIGESKTKIIISVIIFLSAVQLVKFGRSYHRFVPYEVWQPPPETAQFLANKEGRISSFGGEKHWNQILYTKGWQEIEPYLHFRNNLTPNLSSLYRISHLKPYMGMYYTRSSIISTSLKRGEILQNDTLSLHPGSFKILSIGNVKYIVSPYEINQKSLTKVFETTNKKDPVYRIYQNEAVLPRIYFAPRAKKISTLEEFLSHLQKEDFDFHQTVLLEKDFPQPEAEDSLSPNKAKNFNHSQIKILKDNHTELILKVDAPQETFLVVADTYYPGWQVRVDGKAQEIFAANLNQRAIFLTKGNHEVEFKFFSNSFRLGTLISFLTSLVIILLIFLSLSSLFFHRFPRNI